uniref:Uncharacterized protein n=1 Tax=Romanomermis culicivorax TaxID=13658 RepID=A0A915L0V1_ROMCU
MHGHHRPTELTAFLHYAAHLKMILNINYLYATQTYFAAINLEILTKDWWQAPITSQYQHRKNNIQPGVAKRCKYRGLYCPNPHKVVLRDGPVTDDDDRLGALLPPSEKGTSIAVREECDFDNIDILGERPSVFEFLGEAMLTAASSSESAIKQIN